MNCPKCGAPLDDDANFCVSCGAKIDREELESTEEKTESDQNYTASEAEKDDSVVNDTSSAQPAASLFEVSMANGNKIKITPDMIISLVVGTVLIIIGIMRIATAGTSISPTSFGGDFYTYTYQGIVAISEILSEIEVTLGWIVIAIGAAIDVSALRHWGK